MIKYYRISKNIFKKILKIFMHECMTMHKNEFSVKYKLSLIPFYLKLVSKCGLK